MIATVKMLTGHHVTVSEANGELLWGCDCGLRAPGDWCGHMYFVVCCDAAAVPPDEVGHLNEAHRIIARHVEVIQVLTARLMEATRHGDRAREVQQLEAAIARLRESGPSS
jgi:hypothetical protein